jgi:hypothetical protein
MSKSDCTKLKSFCPAKEKPLDSRDSPQNGKIIASYSSDKGIISRIYRELKKFSPQRINTPMKKCAHELNKEFSKKEVQMANKYIKKCSTSLIIKEMQIKTTFRFHFTPVRMAIMNSNNNYKCW